MSVLKKLYTTLTFIGMTLIMMAGLHGCGDTRDDMDKKITEGVKSRIEQNSALAGSNIVVETNDGVVTLSGSVNNQAQEQSAMQDAQSMEGVKRVESNLTIKNGDNGRVQSTNGDTKGTTKGTTGAGTDTMNKGTTTTTTTTTTGTPDTTKSPMNGTTPPTPSTNPNASSGSSY